MPKLTRRATVYLDAELHRALKLKSVEVEESVSELVNEAVRESLAGDASDLATFEVRETEQEYPFEEFVRGLRQRGKL